MPRRSAVLCIALALTLLDATALRAAQPKRSVAQDQRVRRQREALDAERAERRELQERRDDRARERDLEHPERNDDEEEEEKDQIR